MPVHIHDHHGEWNIHLCKARQKGLVALLRIFPIAAPPVAQSIPGQKGYWPGELIKIVNRLKIIPAIAKEVGVNAALLTRMNPALLVKNQGCPVIEEGPSAGIAQAHAKIHIPLFPVDPAVQGPHPLQHIAPLVPGAVAPVQGTCCALQVMLSGRIAVVRPPIVPAPSVIGKCIFHIDVQMIGRKFLFVIYQVKIFCINLQAVLLVPHRKFRAVKIPVPDYLGGTILKFSVLVVLHPKHLGGEHGEAVFVSLHHTLGIWPSVQV